MHSQLINTKTRTDRYGGLRFLMSFMIICMHYNLLMGNIQSLFKFDNSFLNKLVSLFLWFAINMGGKLPICFFVLSGFLISRGYYRKLSTNCISIKQFIKKRIIRIYPLLFISLIIMTLSQWIFYWKYETWWMNRNNDLSHFLISITSIGIGTFFNIIDTVNGPIWYLSILMVCYIFFAIISRLKIIEKRKKELFLLLILIGYTIESYEINLPFLTIPNAYGYVGFFSGVILFFLLENKHINILLLKISYFIIFFILLLYILFRDNFFNLLGTFSYWLPLLLFPSIITIKESRPPLPQTILGRLSFPMFLLHMPIFCTASIFYTQVNNCKHFMIICFIIILISICWLLLEKRITILFENKLNSLLKLFYENAGEEPK